MNQGRSNTPPANTSARATAHTPTTTPQPTRSYSVGIEAQNANGNEITIEINVETATDLPNAITIAQAAVGALPAGYTADAPDEDE